MGCNEICCSANEGCLLVILLFIYLSLLGESSCNCLVVSSVRGWGV